MQILSIFFSLFYIFVVLFAMPYVTAPGLVICMWIAVVLGGISILLQVVSIILTSIAKSRG